MARDPKDVEVTEVIPLDYRIGVEFEYDGCKFKTTKSKSEGVYVQLDISSWVGISIGARHVYGEMKLPYISAQCLSNPKNSPYWTVGKYSSGSVTSDVEGIHKIHLTRPVTRRDKKLDGGDAFNAYDIGDPTDRFDTEEWLIDKAKREFKRIFAPGWILYREKMRQINKKGERELWQTYKEILVAADDRPKPVKKPAVKKDKKQLKLDL